MLQQQEYNERMMDKANAFSLDMWNRTNAYNTPAAQLQRLNDAGLNPLYYGLDGSAAGNVSSAQALSNSMPNMIPNNLGDIIANAIPQASQVAKTKAEATTIDAMRDGQVSILGTQINLNESVTKLNKQQLQESAARIDKLNTEMDIARKQFDLESQRTQSIIMTESVNRALMSIQASKFNEDIKTSILQRYLSTLQTFNDVAYKRAVTNLTNQQNQSEYYRTQQEYFKAGGVQLDNINKYQDILTKDVNYEMLTEALKKQKTENEIYLDNAELVFYLNLCTDFLGGLGDAVSIFGKASKYFGKAKSTLQSPDESSN